MPVCRFGVAECQGRTNTTGGVLLEDGTANFVVEDSSFARILGNALWTHSRYNHERNGPGVMRRNTFVEIARDAVQVGHAFGVDVVENRMERIGYPQEAIDVEGGGTPGGYGGECGWVELLAECDGGDQREVF